MAVNGSSQGLTVEQRRVLQMLAGSPNGCRWPRYEVAATVGEMKSFLSVISKNSGRRPNLLRNNIFLTGICEPLAADRRRNKAFYVAGRFEDINLR
jgi:hypothetical protein